MQRGKNPSLSISEVDNFLIYVSRLSCNWYNKNVVEHKGIIETANKIMNKQGEERIFLANCSDLSQ